MRNWIALLSLLMIPVSVAIAAESIPLEITADKALEWDQKNKSYIARGNAMAKQGDLSVTAATLTAKYQGNDNSTSDITTLEAEGSVTLTSGGNVATGDKATYDLTTGKAVLNGARPKIVQSNKNTLEADQIIVWTQTSSDGATSGKLDHAEAIGHVVITTAQQVATGDKATYQANTDIAELIGNVTIKQGDNLLQGARAEMNLTTHLNKMVGDTSKQGRVKGIFYPGSGKQK